MSPVFVVLSICYYSNSVYSNSHRILVRMQEVH